MLEIVESNQENWRDTPKDWILKWLHLLWGQFIRLLSDELLSNELLSDIWHLPGNSRLPAAEPCMDCVWWLVLWLQCHFSTVGRVRNLGVWERPKNVASKMLHWFQNLFLPCWSDSDKFAKKKCIFTLKNKDCCNQNKILLQFRKFTYVYSTQCYDERDPKINNNLTYTQ
jgi:hypothetical protein